MSRSTQNQRLVRINTVLGKDALIVQSVQGAHVMSEGFRYTLDVYSDALDAIAGDKLIGTNATFIVMNDGGEPINYNGFITQMSALGLSKDRATLSYRITLESGLFFLTKQTDCRIFQEKTIPDILGIVLKPLINGGFIKYKPALTGDHSEKRFIVQYNETNEAFFKRLCRLENIAFYFTMDNGSHTLKLIDNIGACETISEPIRFQPHTMAHDHLDTWSQHSRFVTGAYAQRTYNYKQASQGIMPMSEKTAGDKSKLTHSQQSESYLYTEDYNTLGEGKQHLKRTMDKATERQRFFQGGGDCRFLNVGQHFRIKPVPEGSKLASPDETYTTTRVELSASVLGGKVRNSLEAVPKGELVYPQGEKPVIHSMQTATVTGPDGSEIYTDKYGRIKVRFHWDRNDDVSGQDRTCYLRVMQAMAGPNMGAQFTPRIGDEVVISFANGDPDRPFVSGSLHHPEHLPPYSNHNGTRNGIRTRSTKGGSVANCNELYFEDTKGKEEVYLQAEKDHSVYVKNDQKIKIDNNKSQHVIKNESNKVDGNYTINVGKQLLIQAGQKIVLKVGGSSITITGSKIDISSSKVDVNGGKIELN